MISEQMPDEGIVLNGLSQIYYWISGDLWADLELWCQKFLLIFNHAYLIDFQLIKGFIVCLERFMDLFIVNYSLERDISL